MGAAQLLYFVKLWEPDKSSISCFALLEGCIVFHLFVFLSFGSAVIVDEVPNILDSLISKDNFLFLLLDDELLERKVRVD